MVSCVVYHTQEYHLIIMRNYSKVFVYSKKKKTKEIVVELQMNQS